MRCTITYFAMRMALARLRNTHLGRFLPVLGPRFVRGLFFALRMTAAPENSANRMPMHGMVEDVRTRITLKNIIVAEIYMSLIHI